jgi:PD-(D/E)XK nuclease superfamily
MKLVGSYTLLKCFENCRRQAHHRYVLKDKPFVETKEIKWGTQVHEALEARVGHKQPLPEGMESYERFAKPIEGAVVEWKAGIREDGSPCDFFAKDVWFRGKLDVTLVGGRYACIVDWKTGKRREDPDELELFAVLLKAKHRSLEKITGFYVWLRDGALGQSHDLSGTVVKLAELRGRMEKVKEALRAEHWPPHQGPLCGWCNVTTCEFHP